MATARSIVFSNWRTLPGQSKLRRAQSDSSLILKMLFCAALAYFFQEVAGQKFNVFTPFAQTAAHQWELR